MITLSIIMLALCFLGWAGMRVGALALALLLVTTNVIVDLLDDAILFFRNLNSK